MNIFELLNETYELPSKVKLFEAFSGIGCQRMGFERAGIDYEVVGISEIDNYALKSYEAMFGECPNFGSITDIKGKELPKIDVFTWSFPCTDLSKAGKKQGMSKDTRSGLVYEVLRILKEAKEANTLPKVLIMENVVDLVQLKFIRQFQEIQKELEDLGYTNYTETLNAKNYGVAQNRDRVFMVSILGDYYYEFPKPIKLEKRLKDYLEDNVEDKYYLKDRMINYISNDNEKWTGNNSSSLINKSIASTINTGEGSRRADASNYIGDSLPENFDLKSHLKSVRIGGLFDDDKGKHQAGSIWHTEALSPTIDTMQGGYRQPMIVEKNNIELVIGSKQKNAYVGTLDESSPTLTSAMGMGGGHIPMIVKSMITDDGVVDNGLYLHNGEAFLREELIDMSRCLKANKHDAAVNNCLRIRKLTPRECWRIMGIDDEYFNKASQVVSNSQLYKQAGNGIVVDVFAKIVKSMKK